jgi:hypothetical protein
MRNGFYDLKEITAQYIPFNIISPLLEMVNTSRSLQIPALAPSYNTSHGPWNGSTAAQTPTSNIASSENSKSAYFALPTFVAPSSYSICIWVYGDAKTVPRAATGSTYMMLLHLSPINSIYGTNTIIMYMSLYATSFSIEIQAINSANQVQISSNKWEHVCFGITKTSISS